MPTESSRPEASQETRSIVSRLISWLRWPLALGILAFLYTQNQDGLSQVATREIIWSWFVAAAVLRLVTLVVSMTRWCVTAHPARWPSRHLTGRFGIFGSAEPIPTVRMCSRRYKKAFSCQTFANATRSGRRRWKTARTNNARCITPSNWLVSSTRRTLTRWSSKANITRPISIISLWRPTTPTPGLILPRGRCIWSAARNRPVSLSSASPRCSRTPHSIPQRCFFIPATRWATARKTIRSSPTTG